MLTDIYYFSATGNCLAAASKLASLIPGAKTKNIVKCKTETVITAPDVLGIVCPIYMFNTPYIVQNFIKKIRKPEYVFIVFAGGGELGSGYESAMKLFDNCGIRLSGLYTLTMPNNYVPMGTDSPETIAKYLSDADDKLAFIADNINHCSTYIEKNTAGFIHSKIYPSLLYNLGFKFLPKLAKNFHTDENCTGCGTCIKVCPADNIRLENGKPLWLDKCEQCFACINWCPEASIQYGKKTAGVKRYHHPDVKLEAFISS
jgi:ferredoxin